MKQKLILLALVIGLTIVSQSSLSLGMGKIQVYSALNEPLRSSIDLITNAEEELGELQVQLASSADYQKVGLDKSFVPANIMVAFDEENPYQINVTSNGPVTEPIVSLLLDVNWSNGRILREFTILLDPPVYESSNVTAALNNDVVVEPIVESEVIEPVAEEEATPAEEIATETVTYTNEDVAEYERPSEQVTTTEMLATTNPDSITVQTGDTLWSIANNNKAGDLTTHQMVMAIYNANPSAFIDNNINQLIKGSELNLPDADDARNIAYSEALEQVKSHNQSWAPSSQDYSSIQTETATQDSYQEPASSLDYGVQLSGSDAGDSDNGQSNADETSAEAAMAAEEDLLTTESENSELKERISELEEIVDQQQEVLEIADDGLANLENQLEQAGEEVDENINDNLTVDNGSDAAATADDVWDTVNDDSATEGELSLAVDGIDDTAAEPNIEADDAEQASTDKPVTSSSIPVVKRKPEPSFVEKAMGFVMDNLMWLLIGLVALIALLFVPKMLGGSGDDEEEGGSFLDDIKGRDKPESDGSEDSADTKMNQPLMDDTNQADEFESDEDDVLAELDSSIDFDGDDGDTSDEGDEFSSDLDEEIETTKVKEDDGFDLDGFLNDDDDFDSNMSDTVDHSETLAGVNFDDDEDAKVDDAEVESMTEDPSDDEAEDDAVEVKADDLDDFDLDDFELDEAETNDADEDSTDEADEVLADLENELDDIMSDGEDDSKDSSDEDADDFSFDDEAFDFDLDEELEELEQADDIETSLADEAVEAVADAVNDTSEAAEDEFNNMLDISEEDSQDSFEDDDMESGVDDEIDLGLEDLMEDADAISTKLDLAKAYIEMGDAEGAKNLLDEVFAEGSEEQIAEAKNLMDNM
ncbi:LysM peptidoglycan-binding domain-containing protein [Marinicella sp. S1101]|uniref:FimV/HubP family polar landmark protein n=1 Tax=Marinicella marina TaxID=2996016 RepID=UPI0022609D89|nr:FimV/HubP family polar landmark protein [Marinicella marina]MCX7554440.1 LysM peptidoglycan-binding domain-containing protein [Marinicella marina]MDJ1140591.1 FimV/HubP family polar landmark protein [Marinicella marina]